VKLRTLALTCFLAVSGSGCGGGGGGGNSSPQPTPPPAPTFAQLCTSGTPFLYTLQTGGISDAVKNDATQDLWDCQGNPAGGPEGAPADQTAHLINTVTTDLISDVGSQPPQRTLATIDPATGLFVSVVGP